MTSIQLQRHGQPQLPSLSSSQLRTGGVFLVVLLVLAGTVWLSGIPLRGSDTDAGAGMSLSAGEQGTTLSVTSLEAGASASRTVTIRNPESTEVRLALVENAAPTTAAGGALVLRIEHDERVVYEGPFGAMADVRQDMGWVPARGESTFRFTVSLPETAPPFSAGGQAATATYAWESTP